jgi:ankyrin repeat protein
MDVVLDFVFLFVCSHDVMFNRVMDRLKAAQEGDLPQLRVALTADNVNVVDVGHSWTALHYAANNGHDECVKFCIEMGANVNAHDRYGWTPLHLAPNIPVLRTLLDASGTIVDAKNNHGWTPLRIALQLCNVEYAQLQVDRGAKLSNVILDEFVPVIPDWISAFIESRSKCRYAAIVITGIHKYRRTTVTGNNDINVLRLISKHIWSTRMGIAWNTESNES